MIENNGKKETLSEWMNRDHAGEYIGELTAMNAAGQAANRMWQAVIGVWTLDQIADAATQGLADSDAAKLTMYASQSGEDAAVAIGQFLAICRGCADDRARGGILAAVADARSHD